jgi:hypothetical protein
MGSASHTALGALTTLQSSKMWTGGSLLRPYGSQPRARDWLAGAARSDLVGVDSLSTLEIETTAHTREKTPVGQRAGYISKTCDRMVVAEIIAALA